MVLRVKYYSLQMTRRFFYKVESANEIDSLQNDLTNLVSWSKEWQMLFNSVSISVKLCILVIIIVVLSVTWMKINRKLSLRKRTWELW